MCWTHAKSPLLAGGTPQAARPHGSWPQTSPPQFLRLNGGFVITTSNRWRRPRSSRNFGFAQGVAAPNDYVLDVVEEQVHSGDRGGGEVDLLPVEAHLAQRATRLQHLVRRLDEHPARAAGRS